MTVIRAVSLISCGFQGDFRYRPSRWRFDRDMVRGPSSRYPIRAV